MTLESPFAQTVSMSWPPRWGVPTDDFSATVARFNENAFAGEDPDFERGRSAYDRYYGDPTITPEPEFAAAGQGGALLRGEDGAE